MSLGGEKMELGKKIKSLRLEKGVTQEKLAEQLGVTYQAVSKWENEQTLPDITLLPAISIYFGITIDELFAMSEESQLERIQNMLWKERVLSHEDFLYAERFLTEYVKNTPQQERAQRGKGYCLLAELYNHRANSDHEKAAEYAMLSLTYVPESKDAHCNLVEASKGAIDDWNIKNHHQLIRYYEAFTKKNPTYASGYLYLMDNLLEDHRLEEAKDALKKFKAVRPNYLVKQYEGVIAYQEGKVEEAIRCWNQMVEDYPEEWLAWSCRGHNFAKLSCYQDAIPDLRKAIELQPKPRYTDGYEALAQIYEILGDIPAAIKEYENEILLLKEEWNIEFGEIAEKPRREMERLRKISE